MRERSTWNLHEIARQAADGDIYTMNQDHPQPAMDEYVIGDSSDFAEDVHSPNTWEAEYSGDAVKRNEIGLPELRSDTFNHPEKTASDRVRLKKAELCVAVAKLMMRGKRTASADAIEDQAVALMYMPDAELINTHRRLAQEQQSQEPDEDEADDSFEEDDDSEDEGQAQQKQARARRAGQIPPQFKENVEKMKAKSEDNDDDDDDDGQSKQAGQVPPQFKEQIEKNKAQSDDDDDEDEGQAKQAGEDDDDEIPDFIQKKIDDSKDDKGQGEKKQAKLVKKIKLAMGQQQQLLSQMQQLLQQAQGQQEPIEQDPVAGLQGPALAQQQVPPVAQFQGQDDLDLLLDDGAGVGPIGEADIELDPTGLDTENVVLAGEDEILRSLFAQDQDEQAGDEDEGQGQAQAKQAGVRRTASTRTVGTRPTAGVTKLGGAVSKTAASKQVDSLSSLWASAPDVRSAFGLK